MDWTCVAVATSWDSAARVRFAVDGRPAGTVDRAALPTLARLTAGSTDWHVSDGSVDLRAAAWRRTAVLAELNSALRALGLIHAWRDEPYPLPCEDTLEVLAVIERAASRFWGSLTFGAHATGYVADAAGRPQALWIARRSGTKATDPGLLDNLIGAGVSHGQTPWQALQREAFEEAGLAPALAATAVPGRVIRTHRAVPEGLHHEWLFSHDLPLPGGLVPQNQDGEVAGFELLPPERALPLAAGTDMTIDAALVTLDFALRHGLVALAGQAGLAAAFDALVVPADRAHRAAFAAESGD